jgi:predicted pyridoxine 5'-phosphate oxidase superfamily flavin-nucleotide-binding protein
MEALEHATVTAIDELATLYARPSERVLRKEIDHVDAVGRAFIAASPFLVLATGSSHARILHQVLEAVGPIVAAPRADFLDPRCKRDLSG